MATRVHTTVSGQRIEYEATAKVQTFLDRLQDAIDDPKVTENELVGLAYSRENPFLDHTMFPARGAVTKEVLADPAYAVMTDLIFRKRVAEEGLDIEQIASRYSVSVADAAAQLGVHVSAVRQAIAAKRLASWVRDGKQFLDPKALKAFDVGMRGPRAGAVGGPLEIVMGHASGESLKVKAASPIDGVTRVKGNVVKGQLPSWKRVIVMTSGATGTKRAFVLDQGPDDNELTHGSFSVRGRFVVREKVNSPKRAQEIWEDGQVA